MSFENKPDNIKEAMQSADTEKLSAAGSKGAEVTNSRKSRERERAEIKQLQAEIDREQRELEDAQMRQSANEHIISPDGEDQNYSPNT